LSITREAERVVVVIITSQYDLSDGILLNKLMRVYCVPESFTQMNDVSGTFLTFDLGMS
jgi:hypothetical protein